jgi:hypothetical protein
LNYADLDQNTLQATSYESCEQALGRGLGPPPYTTIRSRIHRPQTPKWHRSLESAVKNIVVRISSSSTQRRDLSGLAHNATQVKERTEPPGSFPFRLLILQPIMAVITLLFLVGLLSSCVHDYYDLTLWSSVNRRRTLWETFQNSFWVLLVLAYLLVVPALTALFTFQDLDSEVNSATIAYKEYCSNLTAYPDPSFPWTLPDVEMQQSRAYRVRPDIYDLCTRSFPADFELQSNVAWMTVLATTSVVLFTLLSLIPLMKMYLRYRRQRERLTAVSQSIPPPPYQYRESVLERPQPGRSHNDKSKPENLSPWDLYGDEEFKENVRRATSMLPDETLEPVRRRSVVSHNRKEVGT